MKSKSLKHKPAGQAPRHHTTHGQHHALVARKTIIINLNVKYVHVIEVFKLTHGRRRVVNIKHTPSI